MTRTPAGKRSLLGATLAGLVLSGALAGTVAAAPTTTEDAIVAVATGQATPKPADVNSNASISAAVAKARALAIPRALINAQVQAAELAAATGMTLGPVTQVSQDTQVGIYFFPFNQYTNRFGPNRFCGPTDTRSVRRVDGARVVTRRTVKRCYVPDYVTTTLTVTFAATRP